MTDAEYSDIDVVLMQADEQEQMGNGVAAQRMRNVAKRLAAIDEVFRGNIVAHAYDPDLCPPEADVMAIRKLKQIHGEQVIDALIAQDLLPKAEVAADE